MINQEVLRQKDGKNKRYEWFIDCVYVTMTTTEVEANEMKIKYQVKVKLICKNAEDERGKRSKVVKMKENLKVGWLVSR